MRDELIGRTLRALRHRRGWRQSDLASACGVSRAVISELERGAIGRHTLDALRDALRAVGGVADLRVWVPGGDLDRLLDADHARLQDRWLRWLVDRGWTAEAEVTFNHYGERGSIDLLAWHPEGRAVLAGEVKSAIVEVGQLAAGLDRKARLAGIIARERGWAPVDAVVPALFVREGSTARRRIASHAGILARLELRGPAAIGWLKAPGVAGGQATAPRGLLCFTRLSDDDSGDRRRAGRQRIRLHRAVPRSLDGSPPASDPPNPAQ